jgi:hypothetical protein
VELNHSSFPKFQVNIILYLMIKEVMQTPTLRQGTLQVTYQQLPPSQLQWYLHYLIPTQGGFSVDILSVMFGVEFSISPYLSPHKLIHRHRPHRAGRREARTIVGLRIQGGH